MAYAFAKRVLEGRKRTATIVVDTPAEMTQIEVVQPCSTLAEFDRAMEKFQQDLNEAKKKAREWIAFGFQG